MKYFSKKTRFFLKKTSFFWDFSEKQIKTRQKNTRPEEDGCEESEQANTKKQSKFTTYFLIMQIFLIPLTLIA